MTDDTESLEDRIKTLETAVEDLQSAMATATGRDLPLLKGTVRSVLGADIETIEELPEAGRSFQAGIDTMHERIQVLEERIAALGDVGTEPSTKQEKYAAVLTFAANKRSSNGKVAVSPSEIRGCTGVSRRYAYDLIESMDENVEGVRVRDPEEGSTGSGGKTKQKALLVDCERVHSDPDTVNQFTTGGGTNGSG